MARKRGKMALYEVMSKAHGRAEQSRTIEPLQPQKKPEPVISVKPVPVVEEIEVPEVQETVNWRKKPRYLQYNLGRIEFSIPYQLAITAGLGLLLLLLLAFRFGQYSSRQQPVSPPAGNSVVGDNSRSGTALPGLASPATRPTTEIDNTERTVSSTTGTPVSRENITTLGDPDGTNVIVIAEYKAVRDLQPVQQFFSENGIPTQLYQVGDKVQLWTVDKFKDNPANPGTKGNEVIKYIEKIGKNYKAPDNYESFAPHKFSDAYGRKVEN
jgi:hypothetical protein